MPASDSGPTRPIAYTSFAAVFILFLINLLNYMDRFTVAAVLDDVLHYYKWGETEGGLLQTVFVVAYMCFAPLFGYLGDRYSRKYLMAIGVTFWSLTTLAGSFVGPSHGWLFFLFRGLVGVGEASYSTIAPTLIADMFLGEMRTKMLALFFFAIPVGSGLGFVVGGQMLSVFGEWQWALRVTPPLGILCVFLILFILDEPIRGQSEGITHVEESEIKEDLRFLMHNKSYVYSTLGFTCCCFTIGALSWWAPVFMVKSTKISKVALTKGQITLIFGAITAFAGILGVIIGSGGAAIYRKSNARADAILCAIGIFVSIPFAVVGIAVPDVNITLSWISIFFAVVALCINWTLVADILLYVVPANRRAFAQAMQILMSHLLGDAASPFIVGMLNDFFLGSDRNDDLRAYRSLQYAMAPMAFVLLIGGIFFLKCATHIVSDKNTCKLMTQGNVSMEDHGITRGTIPAPVYYPTVNHLVDGHRGPSPLGANSMTHLNQPEDQNSIHA